MRAMNAKIRSGEVEKDYLCIALGSPNPPEGTLEGYIAKGPGQKRVRVLSAPEPGAQRALTRYRTLAQSGGLSLLRCELLTGRTHQIRAQFAAAGHPLLGDGQYGDARANQRYGRPFQALYADQVAFHFQGEAGVLDSLNGRRFRAADVPFVRDYFPGFVELDKT